MPGQGAGLQAVIPLKNRDGRRGRRPSRTEKARHLKNLGRVRGLADRRYGGFQRNLNRLPVPGLLLRRINIRPHRSGEESRKMPHQTGAAHSDPVSIHTNLSRGAAHGDTTRSVFAARL